MKKMNLKIIDNTIFLFTFTCILFLMANITHAADKLPAIPHRLDKILGQPNEKNTMVNRIVANRGFHIGGVHIDSFTTPNRIYVLDSGNNRILGFLGYKGPNGEADIVIGQPALFDSGTSNGDNTQYMLPTASTLAFQPSPYVISTLESPRSTQMATDRAGNLYVMDIDNNRVLKYNDPFGTDQIADEVWGQDDFVHRDANRGQAQPSDNTLWTGWTGGVFSSGVDVDSYGNLWVADTGNNRVLRFPNGSKAADLVLGQNNFTSNRGPDGFNKPLNKMCKPVAVRVHPQTGEVYVLEGEWAGQARLLVFKPPFSNGMSAYKEIGRAYYQDQEPPDKDINWQLIQGKWVHVTTGLNWPRGFCFDPSGQGDIWVGDAVNYRVLLFDRVGNMVDVIGQKDFETRGILGLPGQAYRLPDGTLANLGDTNGEIGVDSDGNLYIPEPYHRHITRFGTPLNRDPNDPYRYVWSNGLLLYKGWNQYSGRTFLNAIGMSKTDTQLFVSDGQRILVWDNYQQAQTFQEASYVIGQDRMDENNNNNGGIFSARSAGPQTVDRSGRLWVAAFYRIEVFQTPITGSGKDYHRIKTLESNQNVLWADDGTPVEFNPSGGLVYDDTNDALWVSDGSHNRILRISYPMGTAVVDLVIGQPNKESRSPNAGLGDPNEKGFGNPWSLSLDNFGNLYVVDSSFEGGGNRRMLRFDASALRPVVGNIFPLPSANGVFGQPNFSTADLGYGPGWPTWVTFDSQNHMLLLVDSYSWATQQYERAFFYETPHIGITPQPTAILGLPFGQAATAYFDGDDNHLIIQDHTWNRILFVTLNLPTDSTSPSTPTVTDEGQYTSNNNQLYASWTSSDPESGISEYQYQILDGGGGSGEFVGATVVRVFRDWTSTGTNDYVTAGGLGLQNGITYYFEVKAKNGAGLWSEAGYSDGITVDNANRPPEIKPIGDQKITEGQVLEFIVSASDPDGDNLIELKALNLPEGAKFEILQRIAIYPTPSGIQGQFTWTPDYTQSGEYKVTFSASDGKLSDEEIITIIVNDYNPLLPDLASINIKFYKPQSEEIPQNEVTPIVGQLVTCKAILKNIGKSNTGIFNVKWFLDGKQVGYGSHSNLPQGKTSNDNVRFDWTPTTPGMYTLIFRADADNHVYESNERNNIIRRTVYVRPMPKPRGIVSKKR